MKRHRSLSFLADVRGNFAIMTALVMPAMVAAGGLAVEVGYWYYTTLQMQNAADSAVVAAASNGTSSYATEAQTVAALYGCKNGVNNVTVTVSNSATCPSGESSCYSVNITSLIPLYLSAVVGYGGTTTANGTHYTALSSTAVAETPSAPFTRAHPRVFARGR
jgi:Flp pilus assembly protein TadG